MMPPPPRSTLVPYPTLFLSHLTLGTNPTGTISFTLYSRVGRTCSVFTSSATVDHGNGDYSTGNFTATHAGTYDTSSPTSRRPLKTTAAPTAVCASAPAAATRY